MALARTARDCVYGMAAGGLAGTLYGYDAIPQSWIETLRDKNIITSCLFGEAR